MFWGGEFRGEGTDPLMEGSAEGRFTFPLLFAKRFRVKGLP